MLSDGYCLDEPLLDGRDGASCLMMAWSHDASFCPVMVVAWMIEPLMMG